MENFRHLPPAGLDMPFSLLATKIYKSSSNYSISMLIVKELTRITGEILLRFGVTEQSELDDTLLMWIKMVG